MLLNMALLLNQLLKVKNFNKIGIAFCGNHNFVFKEFFAFSIFIPYYIRKEIKKYDTIFHITLKLML